MGGAYEEATIGSTAPCKAGPHIHHEEDIAGKTEMEGERLEAMIGRKEVIDDEERIRKEGERLEAMEAHD